MEIFKVIWLLGWSTFAFYRLEGKEDRSKVAKNEDRCFFTCYIWWKPPQNSYFISHCYNELGYSKKLALKRYKLSIIICVLIWLHKLSRFAFLLNLFTLLRMLQSFRVPSKFKTKNNSSYSLTYFGRRRKIKGRIFFLREGRVFPIPLEWEKLALLSKKLTVKTELGRNKIEKTSRLRIVWQHLLN